jgi:hypothetical protein
MFDGYIAIYQYHVGLVGHVIGRADVRDADAYKYAV